MNAGIVILPDGITPCIAYDEALPYPVKAVEFNRADFLVTLVYDVKPGRGRSKFNAKREGKTFEFPLDRSFAELILKHNTVAVASVIKGQLTDIQRFSVNIVSR